MKPLQTFLLALFLFLFIVNSSFGEESTTPYQIIKGKLHVLHHSIPSQILWDYRNQKNAEEEGLVSIAIHQSPNEQWLIAIINVGWERREIWLAPKRGKPALIPHKADGKHLMTIYFGDHDFGIYWGGMGYLTGEFFNYAAPQNSIVVEQIAFYEEQRDLYISLEQITKGVIIIGSVFQGKPPLKFNVDISSVKYTLDLYTAHNAYLKGQNLVLEWEPRLKLPPFMYDLQSKKRIHP